MCFANAIQVVGADAKPPAGLTLTTIPDGRMRAHQQSLCQQLALKRMSCGLSSLSAGELSSGCRVVFRSLYGVPAQDELAVSISNVLNEVECTLALLGNLPWSAGAEQQRANGDYRFSDVLVAALCAFQVREPVLCECQTTGWLAGGQQQCAEFQLNIIPLQHLCSSA